jgi:hypothetical protein
LVIELDRAGPERIHRQGTGTRPSRLLCFVTGSLVGGQRRAAVEDQAHEREE